MSKLLASVLCLALAGIGADAKTITVRNDMGGSIEKRLVQISEIKASGDIVVIARECHSSCTMLLGLPNTCVKPNARIGFHGPQSQFQGVSLPPKEFEHYSRVMADHYPDDMASWFMAEGRETIIGLIVLTGSQVIAMGAKPCR